MVQAKITIFHKDKKGEAVPYKRKLGKRRKHSVVIHRDYRAWSRQ
jgi:hypothetical protein